MNHVKNKFRPTIQEEKNKTMSNMNSKNEQI